MEVDGISVLVPRGKIIGHGVSGLADLLPCGRRVVKTPWSGGRNSECRKELALEATVYRRIAERYGTHPHLMSLLEFDDVSCTLTLDYMANGNLRDYLRDQSEVSQRQRHIWTRSLAAGFEALHALDVLHGDLTPENLFLDSDLVLKIGDFAGCAIDGVDSTTEAATGFFPMHIRWQDPLTVHTDLFAFGSCVYEIMTGEKPFHGVPERQTAILMSLCQFPDLVGVTCADIIRDCWLLQAQSASSVLARIAETLGGPPVEERALPSE